MATRLEGCEACMRQVFVKIWKIWRENEKEKEREEEEERQAL